MGRPSDPLKQLAKTLPKAIRSSLEEVFELWVRAYAPEHFRRTAFGRYAAAYADSAKRDLRQWRERHARAIASGREDATPEPLVDSGRFEAAICSGGYTFSGTNRRLRARFVGVPTYVTSRNRFSSFRPADALLSWTDAEYDTMQQTFHAWIVRFLQQDDIPAKSYGKAVIS